MREITGPIESQMTMRERENGSGATEDRETMVEYNEVREMNNEFELVNEYRERDENKEMMEYNEYEQTMRFCGETDAVTVHMIKMNIKLPNPT
eukprot:4542245-Amphidinium_carterae.1